MKTVQLKISIFTLFMLAATGAFAVLLSPFTSWEDLIRDSPDIVIVRCTETATPKIIRDHMIWSNIEVRSVLKGESKLDSARLFSQYWPKQGEILLIFSTLRTNYYYAAETYRIVPLGLGFNYKVEAESLDEKIRILLRRRLEDLNRELEQGAEEKKRLEIGLEK